MTKSPLLWFFIILIIVLLLAAFAPMERILGSTARIIYLHGAWVWTALVAFLAAGVVGLAGLITHREILKRWSRALGRAGLFFWITYLPLSLWAMQASWNGLFLAEPRWRLAIVFAVGGLLLQLGLTLVDDPTWAAAANIVYFIFLLMALQQTQDVMHPPSPILNSDAPRIQLYFMGLFLLTLFLGWQVTRGMYSLERTPLNHR